MDKLKEMLTPPEVAKRFGCYPQTITRYIREGKLPAINVSFRNRVRWLINPDDLPEFADKYGDQINKPGRKFGYKKPVKIKDLLSSEIDTLKKENAALRKEIEQLRYEKKKLLDDLLQFAVDHE